MTVHVPVVFPRSAKQNGAEEIAADAHVLKLGHFPSLRVWHQTLSSSWHKAH